MRTVVRFEKQDQTWRLADLQKHSEAFAYGLNSIADNFCSPASPVKSRRPYRLYSRLTFTWLLGIYMYPTHL